ncbi:MAG: tetratricopeptide repeat protein [Deltaproteobacteria bacterium]|nr:tetratricopeptide repeat protein [Deltaproteobacteria bacterium]
MDEKAIRERETFLADLEVRFNGGDTQAILDMAQKRLQQTPNDPDARIAICRVWILQGRIDEARDLLQELEAPLDGLARIYASLADIYRKQGLTEEARIYHRKCSVFSSETPEMADEDWRPGNRGEPDGIKTAAEETSDIPADFQTVTLAELYIRQGHLTQAAEVLETILRRDPQQEMAAEKLREVRARLGQEPDSGERDPVIGELSRWLDRVGRLRIHGA